ncbi:winged helix-turn-helix domain-containing protein [Streptomyces sp. NPDC058676]|uniref:winged helix-turn-helix domain-containing protein n=1 Tax=Streptomyces sp. NPDC058676 TaxID=3346593 RepID=UPI003646000F
MNPENATVNVSRKASPQEIAAELRKRIRASVLKPGERLPTQAELAEEFGVERGAVRQALEALQADGLLDHRGRGSRARVAEPAEDVQGPRAALVSLGPHLEAAFTDPEFPDVQIDALCFTAETLMHGLNHMRTVIEDGKVSPRSVRVRCLLPSPDSELTFPVPVSQPEHREAVQREVMLQIDHQIRIMRGAFRSLREVHGLDAGAAFRRIRNTPLTKRYILNGTTVLEGLYHIDTYPKEVQGVGQIDVRDVRGLSSPLFVRRDPAFVAETRKWFDALWESIADSPTLA